MQALAASCEELRARTGKPPLGCIGTCPPPQFLRSGKNQCEIRAKHKSFGKILICPEKFFISFRKLRDVRKNVEIFPPKFSYVLYNFRYFWGEI
jgi:hypothetical protein